MIAAVLVRGLVGVRGDIRDSLESLNLRRKHVCVLLKETKENRGALVKCRNHITYGPVSEETIKELQEKRGEKDASGELKPGYRLHPPRGGWERKGIKKSFREGGALGERPSMDELIKRML